MDSDLKWDIILVGESGIGKTSMILRYVNDSFSARSKTTVAVDLFVKKIKVYEKDVSLNIWDSAGQEVYRSITPMYFRKAYGCILVYDVSRVTTFHALSGWLDEFRKFNETAPVIIVGNKSEDPNKKAVALSVVKSFAKQENIEFMECSAKTGQNVESTFEALIEKIWVNKMAQDAQDEIRNQNLKEEESNKHSLAASLSRKSDRNSIILTDFELENNEQQPSNSPNGAQNKPTVTKKKKKKCC